MSATLACITGSTVCRMVGADQPAAKRLPPRKTPFGDSEIIFFIEDAPAPLYVLPRYGPDRSFCAPSQINHRANMYALKDLGADIVLDWTAVGAITHNLTVGHIVIPDDLIDTTHRRATTFFPDSGLGLLRQFPVFCPTLRNALADVVAEMHMPVRTGGTVAVTEGPRLETPAEVRLLANAGAELITHTLAPEFALAKELQMCFAGVCYVVNYAETGSRHTPFQTGDLFGGLTKSSQAQRARRAADCLGELIGKLLERLPFVQSACECGQSMAHHVETEQLGEDWRTWFEGASE